MSKATVIFLALFTAWGASAAGQDQGSTPLVIEHPAALVCRAQHIPTSWGFENAIVAIEDNAVSFNALGQAWADVRVRNLAGRAVSEAVAVLEYRGPDGRTIARIPVIGSVPASVKDPRIPFPVDRTSDEWGRPLRIGGKAYLSGVHEGLVTPVCPSSAKATFLMIHYTDGSYETLSSPGWGVDATPRLVPPLGKDFPESAVSRPFSVVVGVAISTAGEVTGVSSDPADASPVLSWLRAWMQKDWRFNPALRDGQPTASEFPLLFRIHAGTLLNSDPQLLSFPVPAPSGLIQLLRKQEGGWLVFYGSASEYSVFQ